MNTPTLSPYRRQLIDIIKPLNPTAGAEIGVYKGHTAYWLLKSFPELTLYLVDPWRASDQTSLYYQCGDPVARESQVQMTANKAECLSLIDFAADRCRVMQGTSQGMCQYVADGSIDYCFVDADHRESAVYCDACHWWNKLRDGGILCFHDYENLGGNWTMGVKPGVDKFAAEVGRGVHVGTGFVAWIWK